MNMSTTYVGVNEARSRFSDLVNQVFYGGKQVVVTSRGRPKVVIVKLDQIRKNTSTAAEQTRKTKRRQAFTDLIHLREQIRQETGGTLPDPVETLYQLRHERTQQLLDHLR